MAGVGVAITDGTAAGGASAPGMTSHWPTRIRWGFVRWFAVVSAPTVTPLRRAIDDSESPLRTW